MGTWQHMGDIKGQCRYVTYHVSSGFTKRLEKAANDCKELCIGGGGQR